MPGRVHDRAILDALDAIDPKRFDGEVWRITRRGREALRGSIANGRWSPPGEFEVLYTSLERNGALAEIGFRLSLEPVWPSKIQHEIHRISARAERTLQFADLAALQLLGVDIRRYETFDYAATQSIAAAAHFLEFDGLIVPNARFACANLVIFVERAPGLTLIETQPVDWDSWRRSQRK